MTGRPSDRRPSAGAAGGPTPDELRRTIAQALATAVKLQDLPQVCESLGLAPQRDDERNLWQGKSRYVRRRLMDWELPELLDLASKVARSYSSTRALSRLVEAGNASASHQEAPSPDGPESAVSGGDAGGRD